MKAKTVVVEFAQKWGMSYGIGEVRLFLELHPMLEQENVKLKGFVEQNIEKRMDPFLLLPQAKSLVVFALPYGKKQPTIPKGALRGRFSMGAVEEDYHRIFDGFFHEVVEKLESIGVSAVGFSDTGPLVDRYLAKEVGLGFIGKNRCIHVNEFGSAVFLGYLLVDKPLEATKPFLGSCHDCEICIRSCPTGALRQDGFQMEKCISYLTQKKGVLSHEEMKSMGLQLYGCDVCQVVCPHNNKANWDFMGQESIPILAEILSLTNADFRVRYQGTACGWRGKKMLQRNAVIALGNTGQKTSLPLLAKALMDGSPIVRHTAVRSIVNLGFLEGVVYLKERRLLEKDVTIQIEIEQICSQWEGK